MSCSPTYDTCISEGNDVLVTRLYAYWDRMMPAYFENWSMELALKPDSLCREEIDEISAGLVCLFSVVSS